MLIFWNCVTTHSDEPLSKLRWLRFKMAAWTCGMSFHRVLLAARTFATNGCVSQVLNVKKLSLCKQGKSNFSNYFSECAYMYYIYFCLPSKVFYSWSQLFGIIVYGVQHVRHFSVKSEWSRLCGLFTWESIKSLNEVGSTIFISTTLTSIIYGNCLPQLSVHRGVPTHLKTGVTLYGNACIIIIFGCLWGCFCKIFILDSRWIVHPW